MHPNARVPAWEIRADEVITQRHEVRARTHEARARTHEARA